MREEGKNEQRIANQHGRPCAYGRQINTHSCGFFTGRRDSLSPFYISTKFTRNQTKLDNHKLNTQKKTCHNFGVCGGGGSVWSC